MPFRAVLIATAAVACLTTCCAPRALAADPELRLPSFEHLRQRATESVNVTIDGWPLALARRALDESSDPADRELKRALHGLKAIYIRSFEFPENNQYAEADVAEVRSQLSAPGWNALAQVRQHGHDSENVDIYVSMDHELVTGIAILASSPRQFTIVNIVGSVDPATLGKLGGRLGLPAFHM